MKVSPKILALMAAMAAGVAGAAGTAGTTAGTGIDNYATATYQDPSGKDGTSTSNTVTTVVLPKPSFDITYTNTGANTDGTGGVTTTTPPGHPEANSPTTATVSGGSAAPGKSADYTYTLTNTGNTPLVVDLSSQVPTATASATTVGAPKSVTYTYTDSAGTHTAVTSGQVILPVGSTGITITQTITLPDNAGSGFLYGATPVGTVAGNGVGTVSSTKNTTTGLYDITGTDGKSANGIVGTLNENQITNNAGTPIVDNAQQSYGAGTDLQYVVVKANASSLTNDPDKTPPGTGTITPPGTPPGDTTTVPGYPGTTTPPVTPPGGGEVPKDPNTGNPSTTPIAININGDQQIAYPPADVDKTKPDVVIFTNTITNTTPATTAPNDKIALTPGGDLKNSDGTVKTAGTVLTTDSNGNPTSVKDGNDITWTRTDTGTWTNPNGVTVQFVDPATKTLIDTITVNGGSTGNYQTQVTFPDSNPNANTDPSNPPTGTDTPKAVDVLIKATSGNNKTVSDTTTDTIYPAAATFGDDKAVTQASNVAEDPSKAYGPDSTLDPKLQKTTPGATASFPMDISNSGKYDDTYTLAGAVAIPVSSSETGATPYTDTDGTVHYYKVVPINYTGSGAATTAADATQVVTTPTTGYTKVTVNLPGGGTADVYAPVYTTTTVAKNSVAPVSANVTVPATALVTTYTPTLQQYVNGVSSKIPMSDLNDPLPIAPTGNVVVGKFTNTVDVTSTSSSNPAYDAQRAYNPANSSIAKVDVKANVTATSTVSNPTGFDGMNNTSYRPGVEYNYQIIGKNTYNGTAKNFALSDTLVDTLGFVSATCKVFNTESATYAAPTAGTGIASAPADGASGKVACTAVDLTAGQVQVLDIHVKIK